MNEIVIHGKLSFVPNLNNSSEYEMSVFRKSPVNCKLEEIVSCRWNKGHAQQQFGGEM